MKQCVLGPFGNPVVWAPAQLLAQESILQQELDKALAERPTRPRAEKGYVKKICVGDVWLYSCREPACVDGCWMPPAWLGTNASVNPSSIQNDVFVGRQFIVWNARW